MNSREFDILWDKVISRQAMSIVSNYGDLLFADYLKEDIFTEIKMLLATCKNTYMKDSTKYVDRHKIGAIVIIALLKYSPIKMIGNIYYNAQTKIWSFNEQLAITVALSILKSFIVSELKEEYKDDYIKLNMELSKIKDGIKLPIAKQNHGNYRDNWAIELYHMKREGNYNILAIAHQLFLIEYIAMK